MKTDKRDVERAARNMIERYGDQADKEIDQRIAELEARGEGGAKDFWVKVREEITRLTSLKPDETRH